MIEDGKIQATNDEQWGYLPEQFRVPRGCYMDLENPKELDPVYHLVGSLRANML